MSDHARNTGVLPGLHRRSWPLKATPTQRCYGKEFISGDIDLWANEHVLTLDFPHPGKPTENACIKAFNGALLHRSAATRNAPYRRRNPGGAFKTWAAKSGHPVENPDANPGFCFLIFEAAHH
jgi:transposase InsO family protein